MGREYSASVWVECEDTTTEALRWETLVYRNIITIIYSSIAPMCHLPILSNSQVPVITQHCLLAAATNTCQNACQCCGIVQVSVYSLLCWNTGTTYRAPMFLFAAVGAQRTAEVEQCPTQVWRDEYCIVIPPVSKIYVPW